MLKWEQHECSQELAGSPWEQKCWSVTSTKVFHRISFTEGAKMRRHRVFCDEKKCNWWTNFLFCLSSIQTSPVFKNWQKQNQKAGSFVAFFVQNICFKISHDYTKAACNTKSMEGYTVSGGKQKMLKILMTKLDCLCLELNTLKGK